jgi:hypothetical protein
MASEAIRKEVRDELEVRIKGRFYGHMPQDKSEEPREVAVKALYLVLAGGMCPSCEQAMEEYKKEIDSGDIKVLELEKDEKAMEIVQGLGIYALPALIAEDVEGEYTVVDHSS